MIILYAVGLGFGIGILTQYLVGTHPLTKAIIRLRYDGFRPELPPPRPKTIPPAPTVRED